MNKKLFVATSFSGKVDLETGKVLPEYQSEIEAVLAALRSLDGLTVFCAIEHENWLMSNDPPEVGVENDLEEINKADAMLALLIDRPSEGLQYEMGYAAGQGKTVIAATPTDLKLGYFNQGLANLNQIHHVLYTSPEVLAEQVAKVINA